MNIVIITNYWKNSNGGGVKTFTINLAKEFKKRKDVKVHVLFENGIDPSNYKIKGNKIIFSIKSFLILNKINPDIIFTQGTWYCLFAGYMYKELHNCKLVHTFHTVYSTEIPYIGKLFFQQILNKCDCVTFASKDLYNKISNIWGLKFRKSAITYAGVNYKKVHEEEKNKFRSQFGIKDNSIVLLSQGFTSHILKAEGAKILMKSIKILTKKYPTIMLIITGEGIYSHELKIFAKLENVYDNIIFTGDIQNPYIPLAICDIYMHITLGEGGVSLAILEAMIMSKPIIATSRGGIPEAIINEENGILVEPNEYIIAKKIEWLLNNKEIAKKLGENARKIAEDKYSWKKSADIFLNL